MAMRKTFLSVNIDSALVEQITDAKRFWDVDFSKNNIKSQWLSRTVTAIDAKNFNEIIHSVTGGPAYSYKVDVVKRPLKISRTVTPVAGKKNKVVVTEHTLA